MLHDSVITRTGDCLERPTLSDHFHNLLSAYDQQDARFASAFSILQDAIAQRAFPCASIAVMHAGTLIARKAFGRFTFEDSPTATPETLFDLASLTKVVAATPMAMMLYERGLLDLETPVAAIVPEFLAGAATDSRRKDVTLHMLLAHSSGLPAYEKLFLQAASRNALLHAVFTMSLSADPGTRAAYSDIGFILLGVALERIADQSLSEFCHHEIFAPLALTSTCFNPPAAMRGQIPPTADDKAFRHRIIQGEVQDENASVLGGVAAHAGLFSTAADLATFADALTSGNSILRPETISLFSRRGSSPAGTSRALGWDTPSNPSQSGKYFSPQSYGHLGYTGTSLWIDPARQVSITLLTNRTWPDCANQAIKKVRPAFHDAVMGAI